MRHDERRSIVEAVPRNMRVAIIGLGEAGADLHLPALSGIPSVTIVGACDRDEERRSRAATNWRVPIFHDIETMLTETIPDAVIVATPPGSHAEHCLRSLSHGAHVVCEKPFVTSLDEADRVLAAAEKAGRQIAVNHEFQQMPIFRAIIEGVNDAAAGRLQFAQAWQMVDLPQSSEQGWRKEMAQRTLFEAGAHLVDFLIALFGEKPVSVHASISGATGSDQSDAVVLATLEFSGGRLAQLTQNRTCKGASQYMEVRADTTRASFRASFGGRARVSAGLYRSVRPHLRFEYGSSGLAWREEGNTRRILARNPAHPNVHGTREVLKDALAAFEANVSPRADGRVGRAVLEVVVGCYSSAMTGGRVKLDASGLERLQDFQMGAKAHSVSWPTNSLAP